MLAISVAQEEAEALALEVERARVEAVDVRPPFNNDEDRLAEREAYEEASAEAEW